MAKHTQGPWKREGTLITGNSEMGDVMIAQMKLSTQDANSRIPSHYTQDANAKLIAKAPEMLELLEMVAAGNTEFDALEDRAKALIAQLAL